jgi:hypothetical protein
MQKRSRKFHRDSIDGLENCWFRKIKPREQNNHIGYEQAKFIF